MIPLYAAEEGRIEVVEEARRWERAGIICPDRLSAVRERYRPGVARVNVFFRLLLAGFTALCAFAVLALPGALFRLERLPLAALLLALSPCFAGLADRHLIARRRLYRCGAEEALLALSLAFLAFAVQIVLDRFDLGRLGAAAVDSVVLAGAAAMAFRYGYALAALAVTVAVAYLPFSFAAVLRWSHTAEPRVAAFVLLAALAIWSQSHLSGDRKGKRHLPRGYRWSLEALRIGSLAGLYLDVNYFIHSFAWHRPFGSSAGPLLATWADLLCAVLTAAIPVAALAAGVYSRDRLLLWFGGLAGVGSILTLKYFFHLGYLAEEVTAAGALLIGISLGLVHWLRRASGRERGGFTAEPLLEPALYGFDAEALGAVQPFVPEIRAPAPDGFRPGDGRFGGGGASDGY